MMIKNFQIGNKEIAEGGRAVSLADSEKKSVVVLV